MTEGKTVLMGMSLGELKSLVKELASLQPARLPSGSISSM